ncbi:MAG: hypothetical protein AAFX93_19970 [Verrucomicrobiota bacterium]
MEKDLLSAKVADAWGVGLRTAQKWIKAGHPVDNDKAMAHVILQMKRPSASALARARRILANDRAGQPDASDDASAAASPPPSMESGGDVYALREYYFELTKWAEQERDEVRAKGSREAFLKVDAQIQKSEAHAKKMGVDRGELLPREEVERLVFAFASAGTASVEMLLHDVCERLAVVDFPAEVYAELKPRILYRCLFDPLKRAARVQGSPALPEWFVKIILDAESSYLEVVENASD